VATLRPLGSVKFRLMGPVGEVSGPDLSWEWTDREAITNSGVYVAPPSILTPEFVALRVTYRREGVPVTREAGVRLLPGPTPHETCLGRGQSRSADSVVADELPEAVTKVPPAYPELAREAGIEGLVVVKALVCITGRVSETRVVQSVPMLDAAASDAVRQWIFRPAVRNEAPIAVWVTVPVRFSLHEPS
jgi:TonB family protein